MRPPLLPRRPRARGQDERGSVSLELVVVFPVVLLIIFGGVQAALYYHARNVAFSAAQQGLHEARVEDGSARAAGVAARQFIDNAGGDVLRELTITPSRSATQASVTVRGRSLSVVPGWGGLVVSQTANGPVERLTAP